MKRKEPIESIYAAALEAFSRFGYRKTTLEDIAGTLGMTKTNLYVYAGSKQDLYQKTVRHALLRWQGRVREAVDGETDVRRRFRVMCASAVAYLSEDAALSRLLTLDPDIFPMFPENDPYEDINRNSVEMIRRILEQGIAENRFRRVDLETVPELLFSVYKMFIIRMYIKSKDPSIHRMFEQTIELVTGGLFRKKGG